jgi:molecular chaperone GrpE
MKKKEEEKKEVAPESKEKKAKSAQDELDKLRQDYADILDKYMRLHAEFDNFRKRSSKEKTEFVKFANEGLILELLSILDNFERGIRSAEQKKDFDLLHQGVDMISKQLHSLLEAKGLVRIKAVGQKFDPHQHEPMEVVESDEKDDVVIEEMQPGYLLNGRIIRPAKVKVARKKQEEITEEENKEEECKEE